MGNKARVLVTGVLVLVAAIAGPGRAAQADPIELQTPNVLGAASGAEQDVWVEITGASGSTVGVQVAWAPNDGPCPATMSGPDVHLLPVRTAKLDGASDGSQLIKRIFFVPAGAVPVNSWVYATATTGDTTTEVSNCKLTVPNFPKDLRVSAVTATTATLTWTPAPGVTGHRIVVTRRGGGVLQTFDTGPEGTATVTGLATSYLAFFNVQSLHDVAGPGAGAIVGQAVIPPFRTALSLADQQYRDFAGRPATLTEKYAWNDELWGGKHTSRYKIDQMVDLPSWGGVQDPVIRLFESAFDRLPDGGGLSYWVGRRRGGTSVRMIATVFTQSSEFQRRYGALANADFVKRIYLNVLDRAGDTGGLAYWTKRLNTGAMTRGELVVQFSEGTEHVRKTKYAVGTIDVFTGMLRRMPTSAELATYASPSGPVPRDLVILEVLKMAEYGDRIAS